MARPARANRHDGGDSTLFLIGLAVAVLAATGIWVPVSLAHPPGYHGGGPPRVALGVIGGNITWTTGCTLWLIAELVVLAALVTGVLLAVHAWRSRRSRVDPLARRMATRRDLHRLSPTATEKSARRLRPSLADVDHLDPADTGIYIGDTVAGGMALRQSFEDMAVDIWGPRTGKTTARAIPTIIDFPGPVLVTSVKGDIVDATRDLRTLRGTVFVFDPQDLYGQPQQTWVDLLAGLTTITDARRLAAHFANAERDPGTKSDSFFDPKGAELTANLLLAAAVGHLTVLDAYRWSVNPRDQRPAEILREAGYDLPAESLFGVMHMHDKTRSSIYATAERNLMILTEPSVTAWVTPPSSPGIVRFDPDAFVAAEAGLTDTLYLLSQGGPGSPAPLIAAVTDLVLRAGERLARRSRGRRCDPPVLSMLDEAANICRLGRLPEFYSYFGSAGLPIITILQSYAQGVDVWGREGMRKLWSAANVRTYGGGVAELDFLEELSKLIGPHDVIVRSTSRSSTGWSDGSRSVSWQPQERPILNAADLHALPLGRMVVYSTGSRPALARTRPWQNGPHADAIRASLAHWDPEGGYDAAVHDPDQVLPVEQP